MHSVVLLPLVLQLLHMRLHLLVGPGEHGVQDRAQVEAIVVATI